MQSLMIWTPYIQSRSHSADIVKHFEASASNQIYAARVVAAAAWSPKVMARTIIFFGGSPRIDAPIAFTLGERNFCVNVVFMVSSTS